MGTEFATIKRAPGKPAPLPKKQMIRETPGWRIPSLSPEFANPPGMAALHSFFNISPVAPGEVHPGPRLPLQRKLSIGAVNDPMELEADAVADRVVRGQPAPPGTHSSSLSLRRKCSCEGSGQSCTSCEEEKTKSTSESKVQRKAASTIASAAVPQIVHEVLSSPGQPLDANTRAFFEPRFGHDFSTVRVHEGTRASESALAVNALAYTVGQHIVFGTGAAASKKVLAHELAHTVQQRNAAPYVPEPAPRIEKSPDGGYRFALEPQLDDESSPLEREAGAVVEQLTGNTSMPLQNSAASLTQGPQAPARIQRLRMPVPKPFPLCGKTLTHIDLEPPRPKPLEPCLPPTVLVTRMNIVGRDLTVPPPPGGAGRQVFNLHIGYYTDPATGRYCAIADDSKMCLIGRCVMIGCFPTLREVVEAIVEFLKTLLEIIGILLLAAIIALILEWLLGPILVPALASAGETGGEGTGQAGSGGSAIASASPPSGAGSPSERTQAAV